MSRESLRALREFYQHKQHNTPKKEKNFMFNYNAKDAVECLPAGDYEAELSAVAEKTTKKNGDPMLEVAWTVNINGKNTTIRDYIVPPGGLYKLKQIARTWGKLEEYEAETFDLNEYLGKLITLVLTVQTSDQYPDRNNIKTYSAAKFSPTVVTRKDHVTEDESSKVPF